MAGRAYPEKESAKARQAYRDWSALGPGRTIAQLAERYKVAKGPVPTHNATSLKRWSAAFRWNDRLREEERRREQEQAERESVALDAEEERRLATVRKWEQELFALGAAGVMEAFTFLLDRVRDSNRSAQLIAQREQMGQPLTAEERRSRFISHHVAVAFAELALNMAARGLRVPTVITSTGADASGLDPLDVARLLPEDLREEFLEAAHQEHTRRAGKARSALPAARPFHVAS